MFYILFELSRKNSKRKRRKKEDGEKEIERVFREVVFGKWWGHVCVREIIKKCEKILF